MQYPRSFMRQTGRMGKMDSLFIHHRGRLYKTRRRSSRRLKDRDHLLLRSNHQMGRPVHLSMHLLRRLPVGNRANHTSFQRHNRHRVNLITLINQTRLSGNNLDRASHKIPGNRGL